MAERIPTLRELNRATLARQVLLERKETQTRDDVSHLVGLQAQVPNPPYVGLWTRLRNFRREELTDLMRERRVVRATLMRSTLHLMTSNDYLPAGWSRRRRTSSTGPRTYAELRTEFSRLEPDKNPEALAYAVRTHLALVQVPLAGTWG